MAAQETAFTGAKFPQKWDKQTQIGNVTQLRIYVNERDSFQARNLNIFTNYALSFFDVRTVARWLSQCNMFFYQNQLNFAVWCASAGCGVSAEQVNDKNALVSSVFKFHLYYQAQKRLQEMSCPIPGDTLFKPTENNINVIKYQKLCNEFVVGPNADFRFKGGDNGGLGTMYNYWSKLGYHALKGSLYNPNKFQFLDNSTNEAEKIDYIKQDTAIDGWQQFIPEKSEGFTKAGVVRLDDSIRAYVYCVLGSQAQTRSNILTSPETQQNFVDLLEQSIQSLFSIPESIEKYQNAVSSTNSTVNYTIETGLYMIPADMSLKTISIQKYNNAIVFAENKRPQTQLLKPQIAPHMGPDNAYTINKTYFGIGASAMVFFILKLIAFFHKH